MLLPPGMRKNVGLLASKNLATSSRKPLALDSQLAIRSLARLACSGATYLPL